MKRIRGLVLFGLFAGTGTLAGAEETYTPPGGLYRSNIPPARRQAYFGELHLHTVMSLDAWTYGTRVTPDQAYKFARGETVRVTALQAAREEGVATGAEVPAKRAWPLDFAAVTDHSELIGAMHQLDDPNSAFSRSELGRRLRQNFGARGQVGFRKTVRSVGDQAMPALQDASKASNAWTFEVKAANDNYEPGRFTTFIAYEWSAVADGGGVMHRNVLFNSDHAPAPFTALDSNKPEDLWKYLTSVRAQGIEVIAIPHNSNKSNGNDFDWNASDGRPIDAAYAQERASNEPLVEISQHKGTSETTPELSPTDEFAGFEITDIINPVQHGSYVREAYGRGLIIQSKIGANPFKMGIVGASDFHNGLSTSDENAYAGTGPYGIDPQTLLPSVVIARDALTTTQRGRGASSEEREGAGEGGKHNPVEYRGGAITGVWAEENTRNSIFAALKRKETFATTGTRIRVRMFGGWKFAPATFGTGDWIAHAYAEDVAMGGDLPAKPAQAAAPRFILQAVKDPSGANLDRIQIIKVWLDGGGYEERLFDVALSDHRHDDESGHAPAVGSTVDLKTGAYTNTIGATTLTALWTDPEFDPKVPSVYYARVLEIPTPRWSTLLAVRENLPIPAAVPATIQQRAWTSPIWYTPAPNSPAGHSE